MFSAPQFLVPTDEESARERKREIFHLPWLRGDIHETHCTRMPISRSPIVFHDHRFYETHVYSGLWHL